MCTAVSVPLSGRRGMLFGRTLDLEYRFEEEVVITPRRFPFVFLDGSRTDAHPALIGMAIRKNGYPLYYDAANEAGLCMAGLAFEGYGSYAAPGTAGEKHCTPWELIPYVLTRCGSVKEARVLLDGCILEDVLFSEDMPNRPMHWIVADASGSLTVEPAQGHLTLHDNPVGVMTNSPPFAHQLDRLRDYRHLSAKTPSASLAPQLPHSVYSRGMGALGLPGDWSSCSRFVRAVFLRENAQIPTHEAMFSVLDAVSVPRGAVLCDDGRA
ncbi:MAG: linear amide C-N hydrolase, partial [Clostridia bacterium]|nr:linear amide C-N hydrolase [Clostridia bacterium]